MKSNINLTDIAQALGSFFKRFHTIIFFLVVSGGLFVAILMLLAIINLSSQAATASDRAIDGKFDEATIQLLEQDSSQSASPGDRQNPFIE